MRNYVFAFIVFIVSLLPTIVIAEEYKGDADEIKQLLCTILNQKDIAPYIKTMGNVESERMKESKYNIHYTLKVETEIYRIAYSFDRSTDKDFGSDFFVFAIRLKSKPIFKSESDVKRWLSPFGKVIEEGTGDEKYILAFSDGFEVDNDGEKDYNWSVSVDSPDFSVVRVEWESGFKHTDRFCK